MLLGNCYYKSGRYGPAKYAYQAALRLRPGHREAKRNLAIVLTKLAPKPMETGMGMGTGMGMRM